MDDKTYADVNRTLWDARTPVHAASKFYDVDGFLAGKSSLTKIDEQTLGDVAGKRLLHLQCHFGLDSLSLARKGAIVTAVDFSKAAIAKATELNTAASLNAEFVECDVYETHNHVEGKFDIVYTSWGALAWLPDIARWADMVAQVAHAESRVVVNEFHPVVFMLGDDGELNYEYFGKPDGYDEVSDGTYTDGGEHLKSQREITWNHSLSKTIQAMIDSGFTIGRFSEYDFSPYPCFANVNELAPGEWVIEKYGRNLPYAYSLSCRR